MIRVSLTSLVRLIVMLALAGSALAVGVSRMMPPPLTWRAPCEPDCVAVNRYFYDSTRRDSIWLNRQTGVMTTLPMSNGEALDFAAESPWRDESGRSQVVGRLSSCAAEPGDSGLGRVSFPDGEVVDRVVTNILPTSRPCWFPDTTSRVLYTSGDGRLYRLDFDENASAGPTPVAWRCAPPGMVEGEAGVYLTDPQWPTDPRFSSIIIVSLRTLEPGAKRAVYSQSRIWWLRLGDDARTIVDAGPITQTRDAVDGEAIDERCPVVGRTPGGAFALAFVSKHGLRPWQAWLTPISIDTARPAPVAAAGPAAVVAGDCHPSPPTFAPNGLWLNLSRDGQPLNGSFARFGLHPTSSARGDLARFAPAPRPGSR